MAVPEYLKDKVLLQMKADPQLPRTSPSESFWQMPPHPTLSTIQSPTLARRTTFAIIGSGITGCSVAKHLLEHASKEKGFDVTVFEARTLCSGATGRNGGALTSFAPFHFTELVDEGGLDAAIKIGRYAYETLEKMHALGSATPERQRASEVRRLRGIVGYADQKAFDEAKASVECYNENLPDHKLDSEFLTAQEARERYNMTEVVGAVVFNNGAFWPYRLITQIWSELLQNHRPHLSIETDTAITNICFGGDDNTYPYVLQTPRGCIRATHVIHATNGYAGHLLPNLRGKIFPWRGIMSTQKATAAFGDHGNDHAWSICLTPHYDERTQIFETGLYYSNQNARTKDIFIGGDRAPLDEIVGTDDSVVCSAAEKNIAQVLPRHFQPAWSGRDYSVIQKAWSGVMGITSDGHPLVGRLHEDATGRQGVGEWMAAAFNGYGMPQCWSAGQAVAKMILKEDVSGWLPESYCPSTERLAKLTLEGSWAHLVER